MRAAARAASRTRSASGPAPRRRRGGRTPSSPSRRRCPARGPAGGGRPPGAAPPASRRPRCLPPRSARSGCPSGETWVRNSGGVSRPAFCLAKTAPFGGAPGGGRPYVEEFRPPGLLWRRGDVHRGELGGKARVHGPDLVNVSRRYRTQDGNAEARSRPPGIRMDDIAEGMAVVRSGGSARRSFR